MRGKIDWKFIVMYIAMLLAVLFILWDKPARALESDPFEQPTKIRATCYCDSGTTASGSETRLGIIAGKPEWIGCVACVNAINPDGSVGEFIGYYEILDTGYGRETGIGQSKIFSDRTLGTIEAGETIDFYMPTIHQAEEWVDTYGDYVYIKFIKGEG